MGPRDDSSIDEILDTGTVPEAAKAGVGPEARSAQPAELVQLTPSSLRTVSFSGNSARFSWPL